MPEQHMIAAAPSRLRRWRWGVVCALALMLIGPPLLVGRAAANAQTASDEPGEDYTPQNLKVLPKDISRRELRKLMRSYREQLGVDCGYCHDKDRDTGKINYATDHNPVKARARTMILMNNEINNTYLAQLGDRRYAEPFECAGCHRGQAKPAAVE